jgi:hypothetical protein
MTSKYSKSKKVKKPPPTCKKSPPQPGPPPVPPPALNLKVNWKSQDSWYKLDFTAGFSLPWYPINQTYSAKPQINGTNLSITLAPTAFGILNFWTLTIQLLTQGSLLQSCQKTNVYIPDLAKVNTGPIAMIATEGYNQVIATLTS